MNNLWQQIKLGEVLTPVSRAESVDPAKTYNILGAHWYAKGLYIKDVLTGTGIQAPRVYRVQAGDFVYNRLFAWKGSFALATEENDGCYVSNEFPCFSVNSDRLDGKYLWLYFSRNSAWDEALGLSTGGTPTSRNRLKEGQFLGLTIPLPPVLEQRRIVARIEGLSAKIEEARSLRQRTIEENEALLGVKLGEVFSALASHHPVLPLGSITSHVLDGPHQTPQYLSEGIPFVTVKNMVTGKLILNNLNYISECDHRVFSKRCSAEKGDVLYSKDGATRGKPCLVDTDREFSFFVSVALIKPLRNRLCGPYLVHLLNSNWIRDRMRNKSRGDMIPHIVLKEIKAFPIPLPDLIEQDRIVAYIDDLQRKMDTVKKLQAESEVELNALMPSILSRAFSGEL